jgi:hypothetical protein
LDADAEFNFFFYPPLPEKAVPNGPFPDTTPFSAPVIMLTYFAPAEVVENNIDQRPFLTAFSPETPPFSRACYPIDLVRSCGSR